VERTIVTVVTQGGFRRDFSQTVTILTWLVFHSLSSNKISNFNKGIR